ncbi:MAG TPA: hypothetical protein VG845_00885, partial [Dehalococcoidia bacterium]|nr:hypothetical protein [Dehalococcoidia bacterium]
IRRFQDDYALVDVSDVPEQIACPTLVVVDTIRGSGFSEETWREVASRVPNVSLVMVRGNLPLSMLDETTDAILSFLGEGPQVADRESGGDALQVLMYVRVDHPDATYESILREMSRSRGAVRFATAPDGYVASFRSAQMALDTAVDVQHAFSGQGDPARVRIGIDAVDRMAAGAEGIGLAGHRAVLIGSRAQPGEVLVTDVVRQLVTGKGFPFAPRDALYESSDEPLTVHELRWRD